MNAPERFELFEIPEGRKKIAFEKDTKVPHAGSFMIEREDHTVGNLIRMQLHEDKEVVFAGYKNPHPLEHNIQVRIQTSDKSSPLEAMTKSVSELTMEMKRLEELFNDEVSRNRSQPTHDSGYL